MQLACTPLKFREGKAGEHTEVKRRGRLLSSLRLANNIFCACPRYVDLTLNTDPRMCLCVCVCVYVCVSVRVCVCMCVCIMLHMYAYLLMYVYVNV